MPRAAGAGHAKPLNDEFGVGVDKVVLRRVEMKETLAGRRRAIVVCPPVLLAELGAHGDLDIAGRLQEILASENARRNRDETVIAIDQLGFEEVMDRRLAAGVLFPNQSMVVDGLRHEARLVERRPILDRHDTARHDIQRLVKAARRGA